MHLRWSGPPPADVNSTDVSNDWLFIPWSSHVNKHFWKLHGYIDARITAWEQATMQTADFTNAWAGPPAAHAHHVADARALRFVPPLERQLVPMRPDARIIDRLLQEARALKRE
jgi:hypothetical protein